mmetsp:Transcript_8687/g.24250  ORF Transcript_8687/g.24250 Transcript_8687/m.24250 type:complete len:241 (+) Transcript_8687:669-1391(+)
MGVFKRSLRTPRIRITSRPVSRPFSCRRLMCKMPPPRSCHRHSVSCFTNFQSLHSARKITSSSSSPVGSASDTFFPSCAGCASSLAGSSSVFCCGSSDSSAVSGGSAEADACGGSGVFDAGAPACNVGAVGAVSVRSLFAKACASLALSAKVPFDSDVAAKVKSPPFPVLGAKRDNPEKGFCFVSLCAFKSAKAAIDDGAGGGAAKLLTSLVRGISKGLGRWNGPLLSPKTISAVRFIER